MPGQEDRWDVDDFLEPKEDENYKELEELVEKIEGVESKLCAPEDKLEKPLIFEAVYWDNCSLDRLAEDVTDAVNDGRVDEAIAAPIIRDLLGGIRPKFPGWRQ